MFYQLKKNDFFGYICVGNDESMPTNELALEELSKVTQAKKDFLHEINKNDFFAQVRKPTSRSVYKLNEALIKAIQW
jgi:hypothetical protein